MLFQMLRSVGVDAQLALISSAGPIVKELPSLDQFDHMIVYVSGREQNGGELFLDATEKHTTPIVPRIPGLEDKFSLVLDPNKPILVRTPDYGKEAGEVRIDRTVRLVLKPDSEMAGLSVSEVLTLNSYSSRGMRGYLQSYNSRERRNAIRDLFSDLEKVRVRKLVVENLDQPMENLVLHVEYDLPKAFNRTVDGEPMGRLVGEVPALWEEYYLDLEYDDSRVTPFKLTMPLSIVSNTEFRVPSGFQLTNSKQLAAEGKSNYMQWTTHVKEMEDKFIFESAIRRGVGIFAPSKFEEYYNEVQRAVSAVRCPVKLGRTRLLGN